MVHITYDLSDAGHHFRDIIFRDIQQWVMEQHGYIPWNSFEHLNEWDDKKNTTKVNFNGKETTPKAFWDKNPTTLLFSPHHNYQRNDRCGGKLDRAGKKMCHLEYGWAEVEPDPLTYKRKDGNIIDKRLMIGHRGQKHDLRKTGMPAYPGQVIYSLKIRGITDWSEDERMELDNHITDILTNALVGRQEEHICPDLTYKFPDDYTMVEVANHQSAIDWAICQVSGVCASFEASTKNTPAPEMWACRICKGCYNHSNPKAEHYDFGHNPAPIFDPSQKVCAGCNGIFVLSARLGGNPWDHQFPCAQDECVNPFIYPKKPTTDKHGWQQSFNDERGMNFVGSDPGNPEIDWESKEEYVRKMLDLEKCSDYVSYLGSVAAKGNVKKMDYMCRSRAWEHIAQKTTGWSANMAKEMCHEMMRNMWDQVPADDREVFVRTYCQDEIEIICMEARDACVEDVYEMKRKATADINQMKAEVKLQKEEVKATAASARATLARVQEASRPQGQKIKTLKDEVSRLHEIIAEQKEQLLIVKHIPEKAKWKMVFAQVRRNQQSRLKQPDPEVGYDGDCPYLCRFSGKTRYPDEKYIEQWAVDDYRQASQRALTAQVARQAELAKAQRKKKQVKECPCQVCGKMFPEKQLAEVWGDLLCRRCAK